MRCAALLWMIAFAVLQPAAAEDYHQEELRIPMAAAGPRGLEALLIRPSAPGRYPLALISHGTTSDAEKRHEWTPYIFYRQAIEFARRGFAALVVMRRGNGDSGGDYADRGGCCTLASYLRTAKTSADDLRAAIAAMQGRPDVTTQGMLAIGVSTGGFATLALTSDPPPGLAAAINFAGGLHRAALTGTGSVMSTTRTRWSAPLEPWVRTRGHRRCGSIPRTIRSSNQIWRTGCSPRSPPAAAAPN